MNEKHGGSANAGKSSAQRHKFMVSQYSCKGSLYLNEEDYERGGRPRCYGIEKRLIRSVGTQDAIRSMMTKSKSSNPPSDSDLLTQLKSEREKFIARNGAVESSAERVEKFQYKCYGHSHYSVIEGANHRAITLQPPRCTFGITLREEDDDMFFSLHIANVQLSNDIAYYEPAQREAYRKQRQWEKTNTQSNAEPANELFLKNVAEKTYTNMNKIATALNTELSDDFPQRMLHSSQKICNQFHKTAFKFKKSASTIYRYWLQNDDDGF